MGKKLSFLILILYTINLIGQNATITGVVFDELNTPLEAVNITSGKNGTTTDANGFYQLTVVADKSIAIKYTYLGLKPVVLDDVILNTNEIFEFHPILKNDVTQIDGVVVSPTGERQVTTIKTISPEAIRVIPGANAGVENILKLLPGVSSSNELSTQYSVRGGNYDENLVYINEIEVYRPFLIRSAQQEGLSFVNSDLVQGIKFSSGGFQAKYGDKLSSVLDINYKKPTTQNTTFDVSFLGVSAALELASKDKKFSSIVGARYRDNSLLVNSQETKASFNPVFVDVQTYLSYTISPKFNLGFLGNIAINDYQNEPFNKKATFGTLNEPQTVYIDFTGNENNRYNTAFGALKGVYSLNEHTRLKFIGSIYHTTEEEYGDVIAQYLLNNDTGLAPELANPNAAKGIGGQFTHRRNDLDALLFNAEHKGDFTKNNAVLEWGVKYSHEDIRDQLRESVFVDSVGFSVRPPINTNANNQPETPFTGDLVPYEALNATNFVQTNRLAAFVQYSKNVLANWASVYYNVGVRSQFWQVGGEGLKSAAHTVFSPRAQFSIKPNWEKDIIFRAALGQYHQPPFYRELRNNLGEINTEVKAQKSVHAVLGTEYSFTLWEGPFNLSAEVFYKHLTDVNPYTLNDVRIRYSALNNAVAYAYGAEFRLSGAFVPGTDSWLSLGYLKTEENIDGQGFIARPTDQRLKVGVLFQDYVPSIPSLKMYLNLVYNTGVPGGSPSYTSPYEYQNRLRDYKRADLGISYVFTNEELRNSNKKWLQSFKNLSLGVELFNIFANTNAITNTWIKDVESKQEYAVPNFMTGRVLNVRLKFRL